MSPETRGAIHKVAERASPDGAVRISATPPARSTPPATHDTSAWVCARFASSYSACPSASQPSGRAGGQCGVASLSLALRFDQKTAPSTPPSAPAPTAA